MDQEIVAPSQTELVVVRSVATQDAAGSPGAAEVQDAVECLDAAGFLDVAESQGAVEYRDAAANQGEAGILDVVAHDSTIVMKAGH